MRIIGVRAAFAAAAFLLVSMPVVAHHGAASFDTEKELTLKGTVTEWIWANPHCFLKFAVTDQGGAVRNWIAETSNPPDMINRGWNRNSFKPGDKVTVTVEPVKNGNPVGKVLKVVRADKRVFNTEGEAPGNAPAEPWAR